MAHSDFIVQATAGLSDRTRESRRLRLSEGLSSKVVYNIPIHMYMCIYIYVIYHKNCQCHLQVNLGCTRRKLYQPFFLLVLCILWQTSERLVLWTNSKSRLVMTARTPKSCVAVGKHQEYRRYVFSGARDTNSYVRIIYSLQYSSASLFWERRSTICNKCTVSFARTFMNM